MSPIMNLIRTSIVVLIACAFSAGCGTSNDKSILNPDTGTHSESWVWAGHADQARADLNSCKECHADNLQGGMSGVACARCHLNGILPMTGCTSCHGNPPYGAVFPNRIGVHPQHYLFSNTCDSCHHNAGSGMPLHGNGVADVNLVSAYNAKSGAAAGNGDGTCSKVICHGGQTTPPWLTGGGAIDVNTQCTSCHVYSVPVPLAEYNSFYSGQHDEHVNVLHFECTRCHDTTALAVNHFTSLATTAMEGPASATIRSNLTYTGGTCTPACHGIETW